MKKQKKGIIDFENARNMKRDVLVSTFIPTDSFYELFTDKNHVIIGSRGSGKTALVKMLSHDYLSQLFKERPGIVDEEVTKNFIGIYVATKSEWVSTLKNKPWEDENDKENFFQWRLNIATCLSLLKTLRSCIDEYIKDEISRIRKERSIVESLSQAWLDTENVFSIVELMHRIEDIEYEKNQDLTRQRIEGDVFKSQSKIGVKFEAELFSTLKRGIKLIKRKLPIVESSTWMLCIDETEFLNESYHRILNSYMRSDSDDLTFKLTTTPYRHYTLATNSGAPIRVGHDFNYLYIDRKKSEKEREKFVKKLFNNVTSSLGDKYSEITLDRLLGDSYLLESKSNDWDEDSNEMMLLKEYGTKALINRAEKLYKEDNLRFRNEIARKVHGLLKLKKAVDQDKGHKNLEVYSGVKMFVRCSDGNPRRIIRLLNEFFSRYDDSNAASGDSPIIPKSVQTDIYIAFSADILQRTRSELGCGRKLHKFLNTFGEFLNNHLHNKKFTGDVYSAFEYEDDVLPEFWEVIQSAVEWGLLFPLVNRNNPNLLPVREGKFHIANILAPNFRLLPRGGNVTKFKTILFFQGSSGVNEIGEYQLDLKFES